MNKWVIGGGVIALILIMKQKAKGNTMPTPTQPTTTGASKITISFSSPRNNPFNIRDTSVKWQGVTGSSGGFEEFVDMYHGIRAGAKNTINAITKANKNTIWKLINYLSPAFENPVNAYTKFVADYVGKGINDPLTKSDYPKLLTAIMRFETGKNVNLQEITNVLIAEHLI